MGKAHALAHVALSQHFALASESIIHDYLWLLGDLIHEARNAFDEVHKIKEAKKVNHEN